MPAKVIEIPDIGSVHFYKRRGTRNLRISVTHDGKVRVTLPAWAPYHAGITFVNSKKDWLLANQHSRETTYTGNARIGKAHVLVFAADAKVTKPTSRITLNEIRVQYPPHMHQDHKAVQDIARKASIRALRTQAEKLLPGKLAELASLHGFTYEGVFIKQLKSRWGSCDSKGNITLNLFLMQLPWQLIEYVLVHELVHTKFMNHGTDFWDEFEACLPNAKQLRRIIREHRATVIPS